MFDGLLEIIEVIPKILLMFLPGYIFLYIQDIFKEKPEKNVHLKVLVSIIISYLIYLCTSLVFHYNTDDTKNSIIICVVTSLILSLVWAYVKQTSIYSKILEVLFKRTNNDSIWVDMLNLKKGSNIICFGKFNHKSAIIKGEVDFYEPHEDYCDIALKKYEIKFQYGKKYKAPCEHILYLNTKEIHGLQIIQGK